MMKRFAIYILGLVTILASCTDNSYLDAVPAESTALIAMDPGKMSGINNVAVLKSLLKVSNMDKTGLDLSHKVMLFEAPDGNLGVCVKVNSESSLTETIESLAMKGACPKPIERRGFHFTMLKDSWVAGWSDNSLLIMGPVTIDKQAEMQQQIARYLKQDEDNGITTSRLYAKLDSLDAPITMVAQAQALPAQFVAPFTLGAPKDSDPSQVLISAEMKVNKGIMTMKGQTFSFNKRVDKAIKEATANYRPIKGKYLASMPQDAMMGMFVNVDGTKFLPMMQSNKGVQALLAGINTAVDMDNIIRSVDGDMAIITPTYGENSLTMSMSAQLGNIGWTLDVDYWKHSCPAGGKIVDWQDKAWYYTDNKTTFFFGVTPDLQFYSGSSKEEALASIAKAQKPLSDEIQQMIAGQRLAMVINMNAFSGDKAGAVTSMLKPIFGNVQTIVYTLK
jgi:hypothetical protein